MIIVRIGSAAWPGGSKDGRGSISPESGALKSYPYGFSSRFEGTAGSNPEELLGAAHAAGFTMALSLVLGQSGLTTESMHTSAKVTVQKVEDGFAICDVPLTLQAQVPGADAATFEALVAQAKAGCPVSQVLRAKVTLTASLPD